MKTKYKILGEFFGHLAFGAMMFVGLLLFGGALNLFAHWGIVYVGDQSFTYAMLLVEKLILFADIILTLWWTIWSTYKAMKEMMSAD